MKVKKPRTFSVMTFNIHKGKHPLWRRETLDALRDFIASHAIDLLFLQEIVGADPKREGLDQVAFLADHLESEFCYGRNLVIRDYHHGNAILSRFPIRSWENVDLSTNTFEKRGLLKATIELDGGQLVKAFCCHLNLLRNSRRNQIQRITDALDEASIDFAGPMFAGGDFNDWLRDASEPFFERGWKEAGHESERNHFLTFPAWWPQMALDRLYYRKSNLVRAEAIPFGRFGTISDHLPIVATFEFPPS